jgi:GNAT superfamily N-acetyltransferase
VTRLPLGPPPPLRHEPLSEIHDVEGFCCGNEAIDHFLKSQALAEQAIGLSTTHVAVEAVNARRIVGFFSLSPISIRIDPAALTALQIEQHIPYRMLGGYLLGRLGTARDYQKQGVGSALVAIARGIAVRSKGESGGVFLAVDGKDDDLVRWYEYLGFRRIGAGKRLVAKL